MHIKRKITTLLHLATQRRRLFACPHQPAAVDEDVAGQADGVLVVGE